MISASSARAEGSWTRDGGSFLPEEQRRAQSEAAAASVPAGRIATAQDVADAIDYLVGAGLVTGTILPVDGGFTVA